MTFPLPGVTLPTPVGRKEETLMDINESRVSDNESRVAIPDDIREKLQNAVSLLIMLENDLDTQQSDEVHLRAVKVTHEILKAVLNELPG